MGKKIKTILSIETSGKTLSLALTQGTPGSPALLGEIFFDAGFRHSDTLAEACQFLVRGAGLEKTALTHIAVSTGPGSFTGLRVGISFARTLAQFLKIPLIGIPAFEIIARGAETLLAHPKSRVCVLINSIGKEMYLGLFQPKRLKPVEPYAVISAEALKKKLASFKHKKVLFSSEHPPLARHLGAIALERAKSHALKSWRAVKPFYLRPPIAVERKQYRKHK